MIKEEAICAQMKILKEMLLCLHKLVQLSTKYLLKSFKLQKSLFKTQCSA